VRGSLFRREVTAARAGHPVPGIRRDEKGRTRAGRGSCCSFWCDKPRQNFLYEAKGLLWNAMAFVCYEQVQQRHGPFYEAIRPLLAEGEE
jgi:hypothetical protein